jgi:hypothetical protein
MEKFESTFPLLFANPLQVDEGLRSLDTAMNCGFEDYAKVRSDKNLANLRASPKFEPLLEKYDEPGETKDKQVA